MRQLSRSLPAVRTARLSRALLAGALLCSLGCALSTRADAAAGGARLELLAQSNWVAPGGSLSLRLGVQALPPASELAVKVSLYSRSTSATTFNQSIVRGDLANHVPLSTSRSLPVGSAVTGPSNARVGIALPITTNETATQPQGPSLNLSCDPAYCPGVYPLQVALIDTRDGTILSSLVTHLVYLPSASGLVPLDVALVLPIGAHLDLSPLGASTLTPSALQRLAAVVRVLARHPHSPITLEVYPQLLLALERAPDQPVAQQILALLRRELTPGHDATLARTGLVPFSLTGAKQSVQEHEMRAQFTRANAVTQATLGVTASAGVFATPAGLDDAGVRALSALGVRQVVLPNTEASTAPYPLTETAPVVLEPADSAPAGRAPTAYLSDPTFSAAFEQAAAHPVLAAHRVLAQLAQIYFERPADGARGVVVAPDSWPLTASFLTTLLNGLSSLPALHPLSLPSLFGTIPIGANGNPTSATLNGSDKSHTSLSAPEIDGPRKIAATVASVAPGDLALQSALSDSVLLAEASTVGSARGRYLRAAQDTLQGIGNSLQVLADRSITLTASKGQFPITIRTGSIRPLHVLLHLASADLQFPRERATTPIVLSARDNQRFIALSARTSGAFSLHLSLLAPRGGYVLAQGAFTVRSTAVSLVAILLSAGALAVLVLWWARSIYRHRSRRRQGAQHLVS